MNTCMTCLSDNLDIPGYLVPKFINLATAVQFMPCSFESVSFHHLLRKPQVWSSIISSSASVAPCQKAPPLQFSCALPDLQYWPKCSVHLPGFPLFTHRCITFWEGAAPRHLPRPIWWYLWHMWHLGGALPAANLADCMSLLVCCDCLSAESSPQAVPAQVTFFWIFESYQNRVLTFAFAKPNSQ